MSKKPFQWQQIYIRIKVQQPALVMLFPVNKQTYEAYEQDAQVIAQLCGVSLETRRGCLGEILDFVSIPITDAKPIIAKLIEAGHKVGVLEEITKEQ